MTIVIDDAGYGDLLSGVVIGAHRPEAGEFIYRMVDVRFFQGGLYARGEYLSEVRRAALELVGRLAPREGERVEMCRGGILDDAAEELEELLGEARIVRVKVEGEAQRLTEEAYLNELRRLGYEPLGDRAERRAKSFFHMLRWVGERRGRVRHAKTGWPRLRRYRLFAGRWR